MEVKDMSRGVSIGFIYKYNEFLNMEILNKFPSRSLRSESTQCY